MLQARVVLHAWATYQASGYPANVGTIEGIALPMGMSKQDCAHTVEILLEQFPLSGFRKWLGRFYRSEAWLIDEQMRSEPQGYKRMRKELVRQIAAGLEE